MSNRLTKNLIVDRIQYNNSNSNSNSDFLKINKFNGVWYYIDNENINDEINMPFIKITIEDGYYFAQFYSDANFIDIPGVHDRPVIKKHINVINDYEISLSFVPEVNDMSQVYIIPSKKYGLHKSRKTNILFSNDYKTLYLSRTYQQIEFNDIEKNKINKYLGSFNGDSNDFTLKTLTFKKK